MSDPTDFLYPFIESGGEDASRLLDDIEASAASKSGTSAALAAATVERCANQLDVVARAMAGRFARGGRLFTFGNGGSATDALGLAALFATPPHGVPLPAVALVAEEAVLTALGNDVGFDVVFARQLIAHARPDDIALGLSTSGGSENVLRAFAEARGRGLLTVGMAGYDGGRMAACADLEHRLVVRSDSVHRIQESQSTLGFSLWSAVQREVSAR